MGAELSQLQENSTTNERAVSDSEMTPEEKNNKMEIIHSLLDCNDIDFSDRRYETLTQADVESTLSRCGMNLHKLILYENCDSTIMATVKKCCQNLEKFEFRLSKINEDDFIDVFTDMTELKSLTVRSNSLFGEKRENPVDITKILNSVRDDISEIFLLTSTLLSRACLHIFPSNLGRFTNLRHLILKEFDIDNNAVMEISKIKSLIKLEFLSCRIGEGTSFILILPELESLTLQTMTNIDDCIINLPNESKNLKCLKIEWCRAVSVDALKKISYLINLEELNLAMCRDVESDAFASIANGCAKLKILDIKDCGEISGDALVKISNLKNLEVLDISGSRNVNDDVIIEIANNCKKITELHIESCYNVSSLAFDELAKLENLEVLQLVDVPNVGDEIFENMYKLKKLKCTWCYNVTDAGIMRMIKNASQLEFLMLCETGITSKTLVYAADETKKRTNNIVLKVITNDFVFQHYQSLKHDSGHFIDIQEFDVFQLYTVKKS